jgi:hypothetical protein
MGEVWTGLNSLRGGGGGGLREREREGEREEGGAVANTVMNLRVPLSMGNFLTS